MQAIIGYTRASFPSCRLWACEISILQVIEYEKFHFDASTGLEFEGLYLTLCNSQ